MLGELKPVDALTVADLLAHPVWQFANHDEIDETLVHPVSTLPARDMDGKLIGTQVRLANGVLVWAVLGNIDTGSSKKTEHFLSVSFERNGKWFFLSRYHDFDYADRGPEALSEFLGLKVEEIFPIAFDVRRYAIGDIAALVGDIPKEPRERLSKAQIIALAIS